jgi:hypothetical protein
MYRGQNEAKGIYSANSRYISFFLVFSILAGIVCFQSGEVLAEWDYFNYAEALQKSLYFYDAQKCGPDVTGGRLEWRGDCHVGDSRILLSKTSLKNYLDKYSKIVDPDGDNCVDLSGGFHDAGDSIRVGLPQAYTASTLGWSYYEFKDAFKKTGQEEHMQEILKHFTDYFLKCSFFDDQGNLAAFCYSVGDPEADHIYWGPPELHPNLDTLDTSNLINNYIYRPAWFATVESPASDVCAMTSAALALSYLNFKDTDENYANKCLDYSKAMYDFSKKNRGIAKGDYLHYPNLEGDDDKLSWAALWLYTCTRDRRYIDDIDSVSSDGTYTGYLKKIMTSNQDIWKNTWVHSWSTVWGGVFIKLAGMFPDNKRYDYMSRWNLEYWTGGKIPHEGPEDEEYMIPISQTIIENHANFPPGVTPAGFSILSNWGSARYNCAAQLCALVYRKYRPARMDFTDWARSQMEYLMGRNPRGYSYIVGYGQEEGLPSVKHPHHRAAHGSGYNSPSTPSDNKHTLWGALVSGPQQNDAHSDNINDFQCNEVALDYNAAFVGASAGLYLLYGKDEKAIPDFPPKESDNFQYYCKAKLELDNSQQTLVDLLIYNESVHPPHFEKGIKVRYFFDISELFQSKQDINDISFGFVRAENEKITGWPKVAGPFKWDEAGTYYYELDWTGCEVYGKREVKFSISVSIDDGGKTSAYHWSSNNDYSRNGLNLTDYEDAVFIPMYIEGERVFGGEPPKKSVIGTPSADPTSNPPINNTQSPVVAEPPEIIPAAVPSAVTPTVAATCTNTSVPTPDATTKPVPDKITIDFKDIDMHWAKDFIEYAALLNIMSGKGYEVFAPDDYTTRAECAKVITVLLKKYDKNSENNVFSDVGKSDWFYSYISSSFQEKIMIGNADGTFLPERPVTREDLALIFSRILVKYYSLKQIKALNVKNEGILKDTGFDSRKDTLELPFDDADKVSIYASDGVATVVNYGLMTGRPGNIFDPKGRTTRAELAAILYKLVKKYGDAL